MFTSNKYFYYLRYQTDYFLIKNIKRFLKMQKMNEIFLIRQIIEHKTFNYLSLMFILILCNKLIYITEFIFEKIN